MRGKFTTKTIIIAIIALLVLAAAVTGTVVFLKDSGEAAAAQEQELLDAMQNEESEEKIDDTTKNEQDLPELGEEDGQTQEGTSGEDVDNNEDEEGDTSINQSANGNQTSSTNQSTSGTQTEPAPTTVERERVISETTTLGWSNIGLNSTVGASGLAINYNNLQYKVEYYFDEILDEEATDIIGENSKGTIIDTYEGKVKTGYKFEKVENLPLTVTENEEENVIKVYYVKDETQTKTLKYTVEYYVENVKQENDTEVRTEEVWANDPETMEFESALLDKEYTGYEKVSVSPETVGATVENGAVIKVYYEKDETQTKTLKYTVEYYVENVKQENDTEVRTEEVWVNEPDTMEFDSTLLNKEYEGYKKVSVNPETVGATVENGAVIKVYYEKRTDLTYKVEHYTENLDGTWKLEDTDTVANATYGAEAAYEENEYDGFTFDDSLTENKGATVPADNSLVIKLFYTRNTDTKYTVEHYQQNLNDDEYTRVDADTENLTGVTGAEATYTPKTAEEYPGFTYNEDLTTPEDKTIKGDGTLVIKLYYTRKNYTYKVEHYKQNLDGTWNEEPTNTVFVRTDKDGNPIQYGAKAEYDLMNYEGFTNNPELTVNGNVTVPANNNLVIKLYYEANDYSYTINYFYNEKTVASVPSIQKDNQPYRTEVTYEDKSDENGGGWTLKETVITTADGSEIDKSRVRLGIDGDKLVVNVYYVKPIITIEKEANKSSANVGEEIEYTIKLTNSGGTAGTTTVTDQLPSEVEYLSSTPNGNYDSNKKTVTWSVTVGAYDSVELKVTVEVNIDELGSSIENTATATGGVGSDNAITQVNTVTCTTQEIEQGEEGKDNVNIVLVLDISTSMDNTDSGNTKSRLELAKDAIEAFITTLWPAGDTTTNKDATISLILFNKTAWVQTVSGKSVSTINDRAALLSVISGIETDERGTDMYDGLDKAQNLITGTLKTTSPYSSNSNVIIFLGDGKPMNGSTSGNTSSGIISKASTIKASTVGAEIYTIGFGSEAATESTNTSSAYYILKNMASTPSSKYFKTAILGSELASIFTNIAGSVGDGTGTVSGGEVTITLGTEKTLLVDGAHPLVVKSGTTELIKITTTPLPTYFTVESGTLKFNVNAYNRVAETGKEITGGAIEVIYYVQ